MYFSLRAWAHYFFGVIFIATIFVINPAHLSTTYGNGNGRWVDPVDSFSEYLVRNKIINDQLGFENQHSFLLVTKGYVNGDYGWNSEGTGLYYSQYALHARVLSWLASNLDLKNELAFTEFFTLARAVNALLIAMILAAFWMRCFFNRTILAYWLAIFLTAALSGLVLFAGNLYFALSIFLLPFGVMACLYGRSQFHCLCLVTVLLSAVNFLCRFEFATVFSLVTLFPVLIFSRKKLCSERLHDSIFVFIATVAGFAMAVIWHGLAVAAAFHQPLIEGFQMAFSSLRHRTLSWDNVPYPFSFEAAKLWNRRLNDSGFYIFGVDIKKRAVLLFFLLWLPWHIWRRDKESLIIFLWALGCYASWYVFAYQHIMLHSMYDWFTFSLSIGLVIIMQICQTVCKPIRI